MEKLSASTNELLLLINRMTNEEFSYYLSFVTYFLRVNPFKYDLENAKLYWFESETFENEYENTFKEIFSISDDISPIFRDLVDDAERTLNFYLNGHLQGNSSFNHYIKRFINEISVDGLKTILINQFNSEKSREMLSTSESVVELTKKLLSLRDSDSVLDLCSGKGKFLASIEETDDLNGVEIMNENLKDSYLISLLNNKKTNFYHQDALTFEGYSFDKVFCEYPWGYIYNRPLQSLGCEHWKPLPVRDLKRSMTSWLFIAKVLSLLNKDGIAVVHCNDGALFSTYESDVRKLAISKGLLKGVISLPQKMHFSTNVSSSLLVLSYGNSSIRFIDASSFGTINSITKCKELSKSEIEKIVELFNSNIENDIAKTVSNDKVEESYLNVARYLQPTNAPILIKHGKKLDDVLDELIKSVVANSSYLTDNPATGIRVLSSSDIKDGMVDINKLPFLSENGFESLPKNWEKSFLKNGDVVMTNKSTIIKSAIVNISNEKVILFGSLYGIRLKTDLMLPEYLCSFINSNAGQLLLKTIQTGTIISMITVNNLKNLIVPCPDKPKQIRLCEEISITLDMIRESRERIAKLQKSYESSFDELLSEK